MAKFHITLPEFLVPEEKDRDIVNKEKANRKHNKVSCFTRPVQSQIALFLISQWQRTSLHSKEECGLGCWRSGWPGVIWNLVTKLIIAYLGWKWGITVRVNLSGKNSKGDIQNQQKHGSFLFDLFESNTFYLNAYFPMVVERKTPCLLSVSELPILKALAGEYYERMPHLCQSLSYMAAYTLPLGRKRDTRCTLIWIFRGTSKHTGSRVCDLGVWRRGQSTGDCASVLGRKRTWSPLSIPIPAFWVHESLITFY